jgi:predicted transcriptional regulator
VGRVQTAVKAAARRQKAVLLSQQGESNEAIAAKLGVSVVSVYKYLRHYLATDSRFPLGAGITQPIIDEMRAQELNHLESNQRYILQRLLRLHQLKPKNNEEECRIADAMCRNIDAFSRTSDRKSKLYGLDPKPDTSPVTNNNLAIAISSTYTQQDAMRDLAIINGKR